MPKSSAGATTRPPFATDTCKIVVSWYPRAFRDYCARMWRPGPGWPPGLGSRRAPPASPRETGRSLHPWPPSPFQKRPARAHDLHATLWDPREGEGPPETCPSPAAANRSGLQLEPCERTGPGHPVDSYCAGCLPRPLAPHMARPGLRAGLIPRESPRPLPPRVPAALALAVCPPSRPLLILSGSHLLGKLSPSLLL